LDYIKACDQQFTLTTKKSLHITFNIGKVSYNTCVSVNDVDLPLVKSVRDLGVMVSHDLSPTLHVSNIIAKAHKRSAAIYCAFTSRNVDLRVRAYATYVRPIVEHDSVVWSPHCQRY